MNEHGHNPFFLQIMVAIVPGLGLALVPAAAAIIPFLRTSLRRRPIPYCLKLFRCSI
jgi:hypothetical protein